MFTNLIVTNKKLKLKKSNLIAENKELKKKLSVIKDLSAELDAKPVTGKYFTRSGSSHYADMWKLPDFYEKWYDTVFWKYRDVLGQLGWVRHILGTKEVYEIAPEYSFNEKYEDECTGYCDMIIPNPEGPLIHIVDPYTEYITQPCKNITMEQAHSFVGRLLTIEFEIEKYKEPNVISVKVLPYSLYEKVD